jgi:hypothetical protein
MTTLLNSGSPTSSVGQKAIDPEENGVRDLGIFTLPPALAEEAVVTDDARLNSEGYTSRIYMCCS